MKTPLSPEVLAALCLPAAYPDDPSAAGGAAWVQTHLSHVFLTGERVYKFRKDVDLGFVCFSSREERNTDCLREVALNRRLAPEVYRGVSALRVDAGGVRVDAPCETLAADGREVLEHCVVMRRLPESRDALSLLENGRLSEQQLDSVARVLAGFHGAHGLGTPAPFTPSQWLERCTRPAEDNFRLLGEVGPEVVPAALLSLAREGERGFVEQHAARFEARREAGCAVDGHGDLHLQHIWFEHDAAPPVIIDCLEFSDRLRRIDTAADVAFTAMDLGYRGQPLRAERFLRVYAGERDDFDLYGVIDYFASYRAAVRAKVASVAAADAAIAPAQRSAAIESAQRHLELAARSLEPRGGGALLLVGGVVGTGKSTVAGELADALGGAVICSDRVRKHLAGLPADARLEAAGAAGLYAAEAKEGVYAGLLERARPVLASGRAAVLDATWSRRAHRSAARKLAAELGVPAIFFEVRCSSELALERLTRREREGRDASDAGPGRYDASVAAFESWKAGEGEQRVIHTDETGWRETLHRLAADLRG